MDLTPNLCSMAGDDAGERVLDIRPAAEFEAGHLPGAVSHPVSAPSPNTTATEHFERELPSIFLPPREVPLLVVGSSFPWIAELGPHLQGRGRAPVRVLASDKLTPETLCEKGPSSAHLWSAPPWLVDHAGFLPPPAAGPVLDLACGSGRAAVWLAARGYQVTGLDWQPEALVFGRQLAARQGVEVSWQRADLRDLKTIPAGPWSVLLNFRYLQRDLLAQLEAMLRPGGVAYVRTFRQAPGYDGHPHARHRLVADELSANFPRGRCDVLAYEKSHDPDGRPAAGIVARRRS